MVRWLLLAAVLILASHSICRPSVAADERAPVVGVESETALAAEVAAAIGKARRALSDFWRAFDKPESGEEGFSLKVAAPANGGAEHIWIDHLERLDGGRFRGRFGNDPEHIPGKKAGDFIEFGEDQISDWMFMRNGKIVGNETMRPLLTQLPKAQADAYRSMLEKP